MLISYGLARAATVRALDKMPPILAAIFLVGSKPEGAERLVGFVIWARMGRAFATVAATNVDGHTPRALTLTLAHGLGIRVGNAESRIAISKFNFIHRSFIPSFLESAAPAPIGVGAGAANNTAMIVCEGVTHGGVTVSS